MDTDLDTFLVAVYTEIDTFYQAEIAPRKPVRPGPKPRMSDSEVLTLDVIGQWRGSSVRGLLRWADACLRAWFPVQLSQSAFTRRLHDLGTVVATLMGWLADQLGAPATPYQIADTTPVPLARQCRGERHRLFAAEASVGQGGTDRRWYYGCKVLLLLAADGPITGFVIGPAPTQDRWLLEAALSWRQTPPVAPREVTALPPSHAKGGARAGPTGPVWWPGSVGPALAAPIIGDTGFAGVAWQPYWRAALGTTVLTPADRGAGRTPLDRRRFSGWRQVIETVNEALAGPLHLPYPLAKTPWGLVARIAAKCAALNLGIWLNRWLGRADLAIATVFPG